MDKPEQRPEGRLLAEALKLSKLSARKAATLAEMSDGRWGQIVRGYQTMGNEVYAPVRAPADTLARMAQVVGVTPEQLEEAGRADAADELRALMTPDETAPTEDASGEDLVKLGRELIEQGKRLEEQGMRMLGKQPEETDEPDRSAS